MSNLCLYPGVITHKSICDKRTLILSSLLKISIKTCELLTQGNVAWSTI